MRGLGEEFGQIKVGVVGLELFHDAVLFHVLTERLRGKTGSVVAEERLTIERQIEPEEKVEFWPPVRVSRSNTSRFMH